MWKSQIFSLLWHLTAESPCINAGDPNTIVDANETDLDGNPRICLGRIDNGNETFIIVRSRDRQEKENAIHQRFIERMDAALNKLAASIDSGRLKDLADAHRKLGHLQQRCWRAAGAFGRTSEIVSQVGCLRIEQGAPILETGMSQHALFGVIAS